MSTKNMQIPHTGLTGAERAKTARSFQRDSSFAVFVTFVVVDVDSEGGVIPVFLGVLGELGGDP